MQDIYIFGQKSQKREIKNIELTIIININPPPLPKGLQLIQLLLEAHSITIK